MAKFRDNKNSFITGEISPTAMGRTDLPNYKSACKTLRNMILLPVGGAYRRPGTLFHASYAVTDDYAPRIFPFVYSESESYLLFFRKAVSGGATSVAGFRVTGNIGLTGPPHSVVTVSGTHPYELSSAYSLYDEWFEVQMAQSADVMTLVHPRKKPYRIYRTAADTFRIAPFDYDSSGTQLTGTSFRDAWPYLNHNTTATTLTINTATVGTGRTLTASTNIFTSAHIGAVFKVSDGAGAFGCALVTAVPGPATATVQVIVAFGDTAAHDTWWESAWSDERGWPRTVTYFQGRLIYGGSTTVFPTITRASPDSIWHAQTNNQNVMSVAALVVSDSAGDGATTGPTGTQPFTHVLPSQQLNAVQWMASERTLVVGTERNEWIIDKASTADAVYGADNIDSVVSSHFGSEYKPAARSGNELIFCKQSGHELLAITFNLLQNSYVEDPIQTLYDEFPYAEGAFTFGNRKFRVFTWDNTRNVLWCVDTAGNLRGLTRNRALQINGWHSHQMGGYDATRRGGLPSTYAADAYADPIYRAPSGAVVSLCLLPNPSLGVDDVWVVVKRYINGVYAFFIERMIGENFPAQSAYNVNASAGLYLTDASALNAVEAPASAPFVLSYLSHLQGESPVGTAFVSSTGNTDPADTSDGIFYVAGDAVTGLGQTTLQATYPTGLGSTNDAVINLGLNFSSIIEPVRVEAGSQIGSAQGAIKRIHEVVTRFYRTMHAKVGSSASDVKAINFRTASQSMGSSAELFTGDKIQKFPGTYDRDGYIYILCDRPLPFAVISITAEGMASDG